MSTMSGPRIALCMIARDEEAMLGACLASVAGVGDDIVVVDTGSRDRTVEIAKAAGARIVPHVWQDDFAAARNVSIRATDCDWVLVLDADERLTPQAASRLRAVVADAEFQCGLLPLHEATQVDCDFDAVVAGHERSIDVAYLPRLLRNVAELAFSGIIHESPAPWLLESGGEARVVHGLDIIHLGGVPSIR